MADSIQGKPQTVYPRATCPTMYFVGVTTGASSSLKMFPGWADRLGIGGAELLGVDFALHDDPAAYRRIVEHIRQDPLAMGALVTTHKIDLLDAARDLFDGLGEEAEALGEVVSIYKRHGQLLGEARDTHNAMRSLRRFLPTGHWQSGAEVFVLGSGGASMAIVRGLLMLETPPAKIVISDIDAPRLERAGDICRRWDGAGRLRYQRARSAEDNDRVAAALPSGSLVINATGLGKDVPGSPLSDRVRFPSGACVWDLNYRGDLVFLDQARAQAADLGLKVVDGWDYFLYGWSSVIADVFELDIPDTGPLFDDLSELAQSVRG